MYSLLVLSLLGVTGVSVGQILQQGQCDENVPLVQDFDIEQFNGTWHEIRRTDTAVGGDCSTIDFTLVGDDITVFHKTVRENFYREYQGQASVAANTSRLVLNIPSLSSNPIDFWVLSTDFTNFALTYGCENVGTTERRVYLWQLGREEVYPNLWIPANLNTLMVNLFNISNGDLLDVSHSEQACFELPIIEAGQPVILPGQCNANITGVANFQAARFLGVWHQIQSYYSANALGSCNRAQYSDGVDRVNVVNSQIINRTLLTIGGYANVISNDGSGQLNVVLEILPGINAESELLILGTDYEQWAVTYTCNNLSNDTRQVFSWVVSRTRQLPPAAQAQVNQVINSLVELNNLYYETTDQSDASCFYIPEKVDGEPVVFGGQCDLTIPVVTNFSAGDYMGLWHEIERYPTPFQFGGCNNAFYTLGDGEVDVFNTQVLNEQLLTINGVAVPVADGKLVVSFPVQNTNLTTETDYWVLSTDYSSYSLVYSCRNVNDYQQQVTFWKLSRNKQLSTEAQGLINAVIGSVDVLSQDFFEATNQSVEACFYYPDPQPGVPVQFPGTCETNIPVVPNFNLNLFQGEWFEVEAYPKDPQEGQCINHQFSAGTGTAALNFVSSNVEDQLLGSTNGQLTFYAGETGGRFTLSFVSNGTTISFPYYVIATDYTDYALVYSCLNIPDTDFRGIWAWKLSRTKQLSNNGNTQINNAITNSATVTLSNDYFEPIDQSDNACFYFPDLAPGEPVILPGQCDADLPVVQNFNASRYYGRWRLIESYPADNQIGQCNQNTYSEGSGNILVYNNEVFNQTLREINGFAAFVSTETEGKLSVTFPSATDPYELWILGTDYESYSIVYGCTNVNNQQRRVQSWKLSRTTSLTSEAIAAIEAVTSNVTVLNDRYYQNVDQSDDACFYYPIPGSGPNVFRGQCDESIPVVTGFDAVAYMGLWHDVESYAVPFQDGGCPNAFYTLNGELGQVDVFNTQVVANQTLDTITGFATLVPSNDDSAKLLVTFPIMGFNISSPYWVLSTDYTSYALVYSCQNIDEERRSVSSWKLSRSKSLNETAVAIIDGIVNSIPVLDERYYNVRDQSPDGCFYFPDPQPGVPVKFPGQCDDNIPVVPNFNLDLFQGEWFEIETYPKDTQPGECINHQFSNGTDQSTLNFVSTNVFDQLLGTSVGNVTLYPNQNGARFTLSVLDSNGTEFSFPYYIIATDYDNYALAYSCLNIDDDYRGVYAWKLSRTKQLSTAANLDINNAMTNIDILNNDYFEPVDQSDNACFYFPDLAPGEAVILPGQCDQDLPVVTNFDIEKYIGRWRLIESYPSDRQIGQCNQNTYSIDDYGAITVYNNEVFNQTLREITGSATTTALVVNETLGKLIVTFPNGESFELWILDTDYDSYSFAYGCLNENNQQRRVWSWKLSRTTNLTAEANEAIDAVISNTTVLNQRYYQNVDHSDDACFYYPIPGSGPNVFRGQCDESIPVVTGFDAVAYMGLWHDIESYAMPFQDGGCPNAFYTLNGELGQVDVFNTQVVANQTLDTITGFATLVPSNDDSAKLLVTFPIMGFNITSPYWVLSTDYTSYALVYSCQNIDEERRSVSSWKLSRTKALNETAVAIIDGIVNSIPVLDERYYNVRDQSPDGCFYFPDPQPGVPVIFPGQCDDNIPVVSNFDLNRFSGGWHEIQTYPKEEQTGDCINHEFIFTGNANLDMKSYNVIAESLGVTEGIVEFAYNDTTARMTITFTSNGTVIEIPYWIIDTDYDNYALAYSCVNIDDDYRGIWSWKLSRTKQLRPVDDVAINNAMANINVLGNQYFENVDQSDEACFFYPDTAPGETVVFPGQCANISAMPNFNASAYLGLWRTIESYPSQFQLGTCGDAYYSLGDGVVVVYNTEVVNETLSTIYGTAVPATDGTGKLYVTFPNAPFPVEYLVLDTDYETYSLVYSCVNSINSFNSDQRTVFSWKLGRANSLPQAAVTAINNTVNSIDVLDERYYEVIDRSPSGCFYFPEPNNSTVIFRGQCDGNIPVQANFDAVAYTGTWYGIESYPAPFQDGTCGTATYTLNEETGVVYVENTQVLNQVLDVQTGIAVVVDNAKLAVTFEVNGVNITTDYWILATDYTSYSLVYSCQNINDEYKQVNSWKLSKTRSLPAAAEPLINNVINNVQVLSQQYFVPEGHSDNDCFFYPDNEGGDVVLNGQCLPDSQVPAITNFNVNLFEGTWHEVARFPSDLQEGECATTNFSPGAQNSLTITQTTVENEFQTTNVIPGTVSADGRGVFSATIDGVPFEALYILDTDYQEYALIYGCRELVNDTKQIYSWKLARSREGLSPATNTVVDQLVYENVDLFEGYYSYTEQTNDACFHYPEFVELPEAIELTGPCDETIRGIENFDAGAYTGLWMEIEKYPQANQFGTCDRAYYSAGDGNVLVRNTQVVGDSLLEQLGSAEVASTDGTGLLNVTFNVNGIEVFANYYILATDYNNYALVYSCRNVDENTRLVSSWKLSRTTSLSAQAQTAMNAIIEQTQGLSQQYYQSTSQSDDDCFYIPEPNPSSAPLFRGRCEAINGVANFDANRYAGWWHELERYSVDSNIGECISSQYTVSGNAFHVVDTSVASGTAEIVTGTVTVTNDGRLTRVLSNGVTEEITVLDTDYESFALLYSCIDITVDGEDYRRVWSAKHSKSREPSSVNVASIDQTIDNNIVLYHQFYQQVDQSSQACFHYPEVQGQRVILPGQCDLNIPVVPEFDVARYGGTWYQIERYPQVHENPSSTCIGARYLLDEAAGVVNVLNWEVIDGALETIEGTATVTSEDGSAKLAVVLPIVGTNETVTTSLYVLATDYDSYSLVYSCNNINDFQRSIGAWKLSRERILPVAGNSAINDVMSRREELDARYFLSVDQSGECPEPSSSTLLKSSIIVMLVCVVMQLLY